MTRHVKFIIVYVLLGVAATFIYTHQNVAVPINQSLDSIPLKLGDWMTTRQVQFDAKLLQTLRPSDYLFREYRNASGKMVRLYLGYHDGGPESGPIHSPKHCLPGSGWFELSGELKKVNVAESKLSLAQSVYQNDSAKELFLYCFQVKGKTVSDEYSLKFAEIVNSIMHNRRDSAFIRISVPFLHDQDNAEAVAVSFLEAVYPHIKTALPL